MTDAPTTAPSEQNATISHWECSRSEVWYADGSLILQVDRTLFKIHRTVICQCSEIFNDMLAVSDNAGGDTIENCPIVQLPDASNDWEHMLRALYEQSYLDYKKSHPLKVIAAVLRLAIKYSFQSMRVELISRLRRECPTTLSTFSERLCGPRPLRTFNEDVHGDWVSIIDVINLIQDCQALHLLPAAFAKLLGCPTAILFEGRLSASDAYRLLNAQSKIRRDLRDRYNFEWLDEELSVSEDCLTPKKCPKARARFVSQMWSEDLQEDLLRSLFEDFRCEWDDKLCKECSSSCRESYEEGQERLWEDLPECLGLGTWGELLKDVEDE